MTKPPQRRRQYGSTLPAPTKPIRRSSSPLPRGGIRRSNPARKAATLERAHGSPEFRAWMKRQPCVVCGRVPSDAAHLKCGGTGRKSDVAGTVPMCSDRPDARGHHSEYDGRKHAGGKQTFAKTYPHLDLPALAAEIQRRWLDHLTAHQGTAA